MNRRPSPHALSGIQSQGGAGSGARRQEPHEVRIAAFAPEAPVPMHADQGALFVLPEPAGERDPKPPPDGVMAIRVESNGLAVRNTGPHIAAQDFENLFTRFWRAPGATHEGAGLGLAVCEEIAIAHGWRLEARNMDGPAVEFRVSFNPFNPWVRFVPTGLRCSADGCISADTAMCFV